MDAALIDIEEYYNAGTLLGAFVGITASAGLQVKESEVNKELIAQNKDPVTFSPLLTGGKSLEGMPDITKGRITVEPPPPLPEQPGKCQGNECNLSQTDARQIQQALCIAKPSGDFDAQTKNAIALFRTTNVIGNDSFKNKLTDDEISFLLSINGCPGFSNAYERFSFGQDANPNAKTNLDNLATQLGATGVQNVPTNPKNLQELRPSIQRFQEIQGLKPTGVLTPELVDRLSAG